MIKTKTYSGYNPEDASDDCECRRHERLFDFFFETMSIILIFIL